MNSFVGHTYARWLQNRFCWWLWKRVCCPSGWHLWDEVMSANGHYLSCDACDSVAMLDDGWRDAATEKPPYHCESVIGWCSLDDSGFDACEVYYADNGWNSVRDHCEVTAITHWRPMPMMSNAPPELRRDDEGKTT